MSRIFPPSQDPASTPSAPLPPLRHVTVSGVEWRQVLDFTQLFRGFRLAINPAKIVIALLAILLIYAAGRTFDFAWGPRVFNGEIESFQNKPSDQYALWREELLNARTSALESHLQLAASHDKEITPERVEYLKSRPRDAYRVLKQNFESRFYADVADAHETRIKAEEDRKNNLSPPPPDAETPAETEQRDRATAARTLYERVLRAKETVGDGIFDAFLGYEIRQFDALLNNTLALARVSPVRSTNSSDQEIEGSALSSGLISKDPARLWQSDTVAGCIANMVITGPDWLFRGTAPMQWHSGGPDWKTAAATWNGWAKTMIYRAAYLFSITLLAAFSLLVLALAGAMISRLSALEIAGTERTPLKDVILFAFRRLWVFIKAPITPFLILLAIGLIIAAGGLVGAIPIVGELIVGAIFILFLAGGFVLMLLLLGILGGFNLLYPTIAVEGSDAFDAMSRSFAYVYARPWRLLFYTVIALLYGAITFLFVSFAIYLVLSLTHTFAGWGTNLIGYNHGWYSGSSKLDTLWPAPDFGQLLAGTNWYAMSSTEFIGSLFLHFWVYSLICVSGAYVISYYFSIHTLMYLLMRRAVDGQAMTEFYVEETAPDEPVPPSPVVNDSST